MEAGTNLGWEVSYPASAAGALGEVGALSGCPRWGWLEPGGPRGGLRTPGPEGRTFSAKRRGKPLLIAKAFEKLPWPVLEYEL